MNNPTRKFKHGDRIFYGKKSIPAIVKRIGKSGRWENHYLIFGDTPKGYINAWIYWNEIFDIPQKHEKPIAKYIGVFHGTKGKNIKMYDIYGGYSDGDTFTEQQCIDLGIPIPDRKGEP